MRDWPDNLLTELRDALEVFMEINAHMIERGKAGIRADNVRDAIEYQGNLAILLARLNAEIEVEG